MTNVITRKAPSKAKANGHDLKAPFSEQAETGLACSPIAAPHRFAEVADIEPRFFYHDTERVVWEVMQELHAAGWTITPQAVHAKLAENDGARMKLAGGQGAVTAMFNKSDSGDNLERWANAVREKHALREMQRKFLEGAERISNGASLEDMATLAADLLTPRIAPKIKRLTYLTGDALKLENYPLTPLVCRIYYANHTGVIAALEKDGKTTTTLHLLLCLATGKPFLGRFDVPEKKKVIFYSGESGEATLIQNAMMMCESMGEDLTKIPNFILSPSVPRIGDPASMAEFTADLDELKPDVVGIDPFNKAVVCDKPGDMFAMGKLLLEVQDICRPRGITPLYVHHVRKPDRVAKAQPLKLQDLAFSGLSQDVRQWLLIERREAFEPGKPEKFIFRGGGSPNGLGGNWEVDIDKHWHSDPKHRRFSIECRDITPEASEEAKRNAKAAADQAQLSDDVKELIDAASRFHDGETKSNIRDRTTLRGARLDLAIASALKSGKLVPCDVFKANRKAPFDGFKVPMEDQSADSA